jgi:hypothetical protein
VARAKRTDRADARRRYRATQSEAQDGGPDETEGTTAVATASTRKPSSNQSTQPTLPPGARPGFMTAFRAAARPFDLRSDIAYLPTLLTRLPDARAVWIPALAAIGSGAFFLLAQPLGSNGVANLVFQLFVLPPTIAGAFLAGILAPRATYLAGGIAALVGAIVFAVAVAITPVNLATATVPGATPSPSASAAPSGSPDASASAATLDSASPAPSPSPTSGSGIVSDFDKAGAISQSVLLSVPFGIAIGAFGGYYRRFLYLSNPARQRREVEKQRQKQKQASSSTKRRF